MLLSDWTRREKVLLAVVIGVTIALIIVFSSQSSNHADHSTAPSMHTYQPMVKPKKEKHASKKSSMLIVDLKGAVKKPGIYQLSAGSRLYQVIAMAQGLQDEADQKQINLAEKLQDGMAIYIPKKGEKVAPVTGLSGSSVSGHDKKLNINIATAAELQELNGLGPTRAQAIVQYREEKGPFRTIDQITEVPGIGEKTLAKFRKQIVC